jgi:Cupin domain
VPRNLAKECKVPIRVFKQTIAILASTSDTNGVVGAVEVGGPGGAVPPLHVHHREDEAFYVLEGEYSVFIGDDVHGVSRHLDLGTARCAARLSGPFGARQASEPHDARRLRGFFEEVAAIATPDADPRNEMSRLATVAARYGVELLGPPPAPT